MSPYSKCIKKLLDFHLQEQKIIWFLVFSFSFWFQFIQRNEQNIDNSKFKVQQPMCSKYRKMLCSASCINFIPTFGKILAFVVTKAKERPHWDSESREADYNRLSISPSVLISEPGFSPPLTTTLVCIVNT